MKKRSIIIQYNAPVILSFSLLSLLALLLGRLTDGWTAQKLFCVYRAPLTDLLTYPRFFLHVLGHGSFAACCADILILLVIGPPAEERFGSRRLLLAIAVTALATGIAQWVFFPAATLTGASCIVFMLILLASFAGVSGNVIPLTLLLVLALCLGNEIVQAASGQAGLQQMTHIVGGLVGLVFGFTARRHR